MVQRSPRKSDSRGYLDGQLLIAMPSMTDGPFARTVVYLCAHSADGAMGIMINQPAPQITFPDLLVQLEVIPQGAGIRLPMRARRMQVHRGGPVEYRRQRTRERAFVVVGDDLFDKQPDGRCICRRIQPAPAHQFSDLVFDDVDGVHGLP